MRGHREVRARMRRRRNGDGRGQFPRRCPFDGRMLVPMDDGLECPDCLYEEVARR